MLYRVRNKVKTAWAALALLGVELLISIGIFFAALVAFAWLVRRVFVVQKTGFDERAFVFLGGHVNPIRSEVMEDITFFGTHYFLIPLCVVLSIWFLFIRPHRWYSITVPGIAISSVSLMLLLKQIFERPRPLIPLLEAARGFSFPSGHALMSTTVYGLIIYLCYKEVRQPVVRWLLVIAFSILILAICLSRIYLRVHYTSDVLAGISLGLAWLILSITILRRMERWTSKLPPETTGSGAGNL